MQAQPVVANTKLASWGNSKATRLPFEILQKAKITDGQEFSVEVKNGNIILSPITSEPQNLKALFENWEDDGIRSPELDWGKAQGQELQW